MSTICPICKNEVPDGFNVCLSCGSPITPANPTTPVAPQVSTDPFEYSGFQTQAQEPAAYTEAKPMQTQPQAQAPQQPQPQKQPKTAQQQASQEGQPNQPPRVPQNNQFGYPPQNGMYPQQNYGYQQQGYQQFPQGYGQPPQGYPYNQSQQAQPVEEKANVGLAILSWFIPLVGFILYFVEKEKKPKTAKKCGKVALISVLVSVLICILMAALVLAGVFGTLDAAGVWDFDLDSNSGYSEEGDYPNDDWSFTESEDENAIQNDEGLGVTPSDIGNANDSSVSESIATNSSRWQDFQIVYGDQSFNLPITVEKFKEVTGYDFASENDTKKMLNPNYSDSCSFAKDGFIIAVSLYNNKSEAIPYTEANIYRISIYGGTSSNDKSAEMSKWVFAGNIYVGMSTDVNRVQEAVGTCEDIYEADNNSDTYSYYALNYEGDSTYNDFDITISTGVISEISVSYIPE